MARPIEPTPKLSGEDAERLLSDLANACSPEEADRRIALGRGELARMLRVKDLPIRKLRGGVSAPTFMSIETFSRRHRGAPLDDSLCSRLRAIIERDGVPRTCERYGVSPGSIGRAVGGLPVLRGTAALIILGLRTEAV